MILLKKFRGYNADTYYPSLCVGTFELCEETNRTDRVHDDIVKIGKFLDRSDEFSRFLKMRTFSKKERTHVLEDIFKERLHLLTYVFLLFLEHKGRINLLKIICGEFEIIRLRARNMLHVKLATAIDLNDHQRKTIKQHLKGKYNKEIYVEEIVRPELLGGIRMQVGDYLYDCTLKSQLLRFKNSIIHS